MQQRFNLFHLIDERDVATPKSSTQLQLLLFLFVLSLQSTVSELQDERG
jgi:hypothetical protein